MDTTAAVTPEKGLGREDSSERFVHGAHGVAWGLWLTAMAFAGSAFLLILGTFSVDVPSRGYGFRGWVPIVAVLWATIGARIAARQPRNRLGWLILICGWLWSVNAMFEEYATFAYYPQEIGLPFVEGMVWFNTLVGTLVTGVSAVALLVVPDGRLPSRRWTIVAIGVVALTIAAALILAILPRRLAPFPFQNPFGVEELRAYDHTFPAILRGIEAVRGLAVLIPTAALLSRLRHSTGDVRQQLKWVAAPAVFASFAVFLYGVSGSPIFEYATLAGLIFVPIGFGIAMRRYRLYDIDRILNRTIVFGGATAILAGVYAAGIALMQRLFILFTGERSDAAVVLTTLLVAAAFNTVTERLQAFVKRSFATSVPGTHGLDAFTQRIEDHLCLTDRDGLLTQLLGETVEALGAVCGAVEIAGASARTPLHAIGHWTGDAHLAAEIRVGDAVVARVLLGPRTNGELYDARSRARLMRAVELVGVALERIPPRTPEVPRERE
jgi:hypothetical protein